MSSSPWCKSAVAPSRAMRPVGKARRSRLPGVFDGGATPPGGMQRPANAGRPAPRAAGRPSSSVSVMKLGGSVLTGLAGYREAAELLARERSSGAARIVAVVSAQLGHTDALREEARCLAADPDSAAQDLLWSTGEHRSVALLTLALRSAGVDAVGCSVHEIGVRLEANGAGFSVSPSVLRPFIERHQVVVTPGFLAVHEQRIVTLGRGGSDWSAVLLASALGADRCVLVKDVDGYFTDDPASNPDAVLIPALDVAEALRMADAGCPLVQRQALAAARDLGIELVVRSATSAGTVVSDAAAGTFTCAEYVDNIPIRRERT